jgi:hypothetical protein
VRIANAPHNPYWAISNPPKNQKPKDNNAIRKGLNNSLLKIKDEEE